VQSNKADCLIIAERAGQLMEAMIETLRDKREATVDPMLLRDLDRFRRCVGQNLPVRKTH